MLTKRYFAAAVIILPFQFSVLYDAITNDGGASPYFDKFIPLKFHFTFLEFNYFILFIIDRI